METGYYWVYRLSISRWEVLEYAATWQGWRPEWWSMSREYPLDPADLEDYVISHAIPLVSPSVVPAGEPNG